MKKTEPRFIVDTEGRVYDHIEINERKITEEQFQARLRKAQANSEKAIEESLRQTRTAGRTHEKSYLTDEAGIKQFQQHHLKL